LKLPKLLLHFSAQRAARLLRGGGSAKGETGFTIDLRNF
jgi:hypothetical protein